MDTNQTGRCPAPLVSIATLPYGLEATDQGLAIQSNVDTPSPPCREARRNGRTGEAANGAPAGHPEAPRRLDRRAAACRDGLADQGRNGVRERLDTSDQWSPRSCRIRAAVR